MKTWSFAGPVDVSALFVGALALGAIASGCGREPSMASKSAAAYQKAVDEGLPVGSGHGGHGGNEDGDHSGVTTPDPTAEHDHGGGGGATEHPAANPGAVAAADAGQMGGMDHSTPAAPTAIDHSQHAGGSPTADHGAMGHGSRAASPPLPPPTSSSELGQLDPAGTLAPDEFDRVVAPPSTGATEQGVKKEKP